MLEEIVKVRFLQLDAFRAQAGGTYYRMGLGAGIRSGPCTPLSMRSMTRSGPAAMPKPCARRRAGMAPTSLCATLMLVVIPPRDRRRRRWQGWAPHRGCYQLLHPFHWWSCRNSVFIGGRLLSVPVSSVPVFECQTKPGPALVAGVQATNVTGQTVPCGT
jgi:hypothetical protein